MHHREQNERYKRKNPVGENPTYILSESQKEKRETQKLLKLIDNSNPQIQKPNKCQTRMHKRKLILRPVLVIQKNTKDEILKATREKRQIIF